MKTEYSQPFVLTLLTMNGRQTPVDKWRRRLDNGKVEQVENTFQLI